MVLVVSCSRCSHMWWQVAVDLVLRAVSVRVGLRSGEHVARSARRVLEAARLPMAGEESRGQEGRSRASGLVPVPVPERPRPLPPSNREHLDRYPAKNNTGIPAVAARAYARWHTRAHGDTRGYGHATTPPHCCRNLSLRPQQQVNAT